MGTQATRTTAHNREQPRTTVTPLKSDDTRLTAAHVTTTRLTTRRVTTTRATTTARETIHPLSNDEADMSQELLPNIKYDANGLVTAIAQDHESGEILMVAYMTEATLRRTLETSVMTYWSRSRQEIWIKGQTSGNIQEVIETRIDCDGDALLFKVNQHGGAACHTGFKSCFHRRLDDGKLVVDGERVFDPQNVYGS